MDAGTSFPPAGVPLPACLDSTCFYTGSFTIFMIRHLIGCFLFPFATPGLNDTILESSHTSRICTSQQHASVWQTCLLLSPRVLLFGEKSMRFCMTGCGDPPRQQQAGGRGCLAQPVQHPEPHPQDFPLNFLVSDFCVCIILA